MKKFLLTSLIVASAVFAAPAEQAAPAAAAPAAETAPAAQPAPAAEQAAAQPEAKAEAAQPAAEQAAAPAPEAQAPVAEQAAAPATEAAQPATEQAAPAAEATPAEQATAEAAPATEAPAEEQAAAPAEEPKAEEVAATEEAAPAEEAKAVKVEAPIEEVEEIEEIVYVKKKNKKLLESEKFSFDLLADFEIQAGKILWNSEDDEDKNNLEEWTGKADLTAVVETDDFMGVLALEFYPVDNEKTKEEIREDDLNDYVKLTEAWAWQRTKYFNFKLGRWDNTDKNGDHFGGYVDGYLAGFRSSQRSENQMQFGFTPSEFLAMNISLISTGKHLNTGDLRAQFSFHDLQGMKDLRIDITYRSNIFDEVYSSDSDIRHNVSLKGIVPLMKDHISLFVEGALLGLDSQEEKTVTETDKNGKIVTATKTVDGDWYTPITGGLIFETPVVDKIILEAEYIANREDSPYKTSGKHVKDVLGALYLEKALTDRFTLSAGVHSFGSTRDFTISGNLVGRIN